MLRSGGHLGPQTGGIGGGSDMEAVKCYLHPYNVMHSHIKPSIFIWQSSAASSLVACKCETELPEM